MYFVYLKKQIFQEMPQADCAVLPYSDYSCSARALASSMTFCWTLPGASS